MTSASRSNKFDVLNLAASGLEVEEVTAVGVVQGIVGIIVGLGVTKIPRVSGRSDTRALREQRRRRR